MLVRSSLVGMIAIDDTADASFAPLCGRARRLSASAWRHDFAGNAAYAVVAADLGRLSKELDRQFQRLQARLAA